MGRWLIVSSLVAAALLVAPVRDGQTESKSGKTADPDNRVSVSVNHSAAGVATPAESQVPAQRPRSIRLPSGRTMPVEIASTGRDAKLNVPADIDRAGWWNGSSRIGDPYGTIVVAAHVDSVRAGIGPFAELLGARSGQRIRLAGADRSQTFEIDSVRVQPRTSLSASSPVFSGFGDLRLVLVTCSGPFDARQGGYRDNLIVEATPVGGLKPLGR